MKITTTQDNGAGEFTLQEMLDYLKDMNASMKGMSESFDLNSLAQVYALANNIIAGLEARNEPGLIRRAG